MRLAGPYKLDKAQTTSYKTDWEESFRCKTADRPDMSHKIGCFEDCAQFPF